MGDYNDFMNHLFDECLRKRGLDLAGETSGTDALHAIETLNRVLVIVHAMLPGIDGLTRS